MIAPRYVVALALALPAWAQAVTCSAVSGEQRVPVVELFTSEGCNSCPPADRWLSGFVPREGSERGPTVLAYHVDYWDYIGWTDRFADPRHGERHKRLVDASGGRIRYTPQVFVDGREYGQWRRGNRPAAVAEATLRLQAKLAVESDRRLHIDLRADGKRDAPVTVTVALVEHGLTSSVRAGENAGKTLRHDHVVRRVVEREMPKANFELHENIALPPDAAPDHSDVVFVVRGRDFSTLQSMSMPVCNV